MAYPAIRPEQNQPLASGRRNARPLQWQSRFLTAGILSLCGAAAFWDLIRYWSPVAEGALLVSAIFALVAWLARAGTLSAALAGGLLAATMMLASAESTDWLRSALPTLLAVLVLTYAATHFGGRRKERQGTGQDRRGRNTAQVAANLGAAGLASAAVLAASLAHGAPLSMSSAASGGRASAVVLCTGMMIAALAEATADTLSSEIGQVLGGRPVLIGTRNRVEAGVDGGVSLPGSLAGAAGAVAVVIVAATTLRLSLRLATVCVLAAIAGMFFDSILGATAEREGQLNNDAVNFLATFAAALLAAALVLLL